MRISDLSSDVGSSDLGFRAPPKLWRKRLYVQISLRDDPACENDAGRFVRFRNAISVYGKGMVGTAQDMDAADSAPSPAAAHRDSGRAGRSEEHTSELQSLMRISYAVFCLKKKQIRMIKPTTR